METTNTTTTEKESGEAKTEKMYATFIEYFNDSEKRKLIDIPNKNYIAILGPGNLKLLASTLAHSVIADAGESEEDLKILEPLTKKIFDFLTTYQHSHTSVISRGVNTILGS